METCERRMMGALVIVLNMILSLQSDLGYFLHFVSINGLRYNKHGIGTIEPEIPLHCAENSITKPVRESLESSQEVLKYSSQIVYE